MPTRKGGATTARKPAKPATTTASAVPDWLPNWRDAAAYPSEVGTTPERWAWEFLRRNSSYQRDFARVAKLPSAEDRYSRPAEESYILAQPALPGEMLGNWIQRCAQSGSTRFDLIGAHLAKQYRIKQWTHPDGSQGMVKWATRGDWVIDAPFSDTEAELCIAFDLLSSWEEQAKSAQLLFKHMAEKYQKKHGRIVRSRKQKGERAQYQRYLRVLDGEAAEATQSAMAQVIFSDLAKRDPRDAIKRIAQSLKAAKALRDGGYCSLL